MAFIVNKTDGTVLAALPDGTKNNTSSMTLFGKSTLEYGEELNENFIHLLENGANTIPPLNPLVGELWFDKTATLLKVFNGNEFRPISGAIASPVAPNNNTDGTLWWDTNELKIYSWDDNSSSWIFIGGVGGNFDGDFTGTFTGNLIGNVTGNVTGNAGSVTDGVYISGTQTITGAKTFSSTITGDITGNAGSVTDGVYISGTQTITGAKTFSSTITGDITGNAGSVTDGVYRSGTQTITGAKTFLSPVTVNTAGGLNITVGPQLGANCNQLKLVGSFDVQAGAEGLRTFTIKPPTQFASADRTYTLPDVGKDALFVMTEGNQTITGSKTFNNTITGDITGNAGSVTDGVYRSGTQTITGFKEFTNQIKVRGNNSATNDGIVIDPQTIGNNARAIFITTPTQPLSGDRTYTLPDVGGNARFVMTLGDQSISGNKTFTAVTINSGSITNTTVNGNVVGSNSVGQRFVSTALPSGGNDGDIWYQY